MAPLRSLHAAAVQPVAGAGLLFRRGELVVVVEESSDGAVDELLRVCDEAALAAADGRALVRRLARWLVADDTDTAPAFVAVATAEEGLVAFVHGDAEARVADDDGSEQLLSSRDSSTWVDRVLPATTSRVEAFVGVAGDAKVDPRTRLDAGVVTAAGFVVSAAETPVAALPVVLEEEPQDAVVPPPLEPLHVPDEVEPAVAAIDETINRPAFESVLLVDEPSAAEEPAAPAPVVEAGPPVVQGINCKRGHFNSPRSAFCGVCGISMVQQTHNVVEGPRPPLGVIIWDDGSTFRLDRDYVIGREPDFDADVAAGRANPLVIDDEDGTISRAHALVRLDGWDVHLIDRGSVNGTYVAAPDSRTWAALAPYEPAVIVPGTRVQLGRRTFRFEAHVAP